MHLKNPLYHLSNYVSFHNLSTTQKTFLEGLADENWRLAMEREMEASKNKKRTELVSLLKGKNSFCK